MLTPDEDVVLVKLGEAWDAFAKLTRDFAKGGHHDDFQDFKYLIHRLQDMVAARPVYRQMRAEAKNGDVQ